MAKVAKATRVSPARTNGFGARLDGWHEGRPEELNGRVMRDADGATVSTDVD
jgi:hypothetical protein